MERSKVRRVVLLLVLGQFLSLFLAVTSFTSSLIASLGVDTPLTQSLFTYLLLALVYGSILLYRRQKLQNGHMGNGKTIVEKGVKLGNQLLSLLPDEGRKWKVLADFWAEMILFLAPSDNEMAHAESLANGGEFITHLWALLTHAGILKRNSAPLDEENPSPASSSGHEEAALASQHMEEH